MSEASKVGIPQNKLAKSAEQVIDRAFEEARSRDQRLVTEHHICMAFARMEWDMFSRVTRDLNLNPHEILQALEEHVDAIPRNAGTKFHVTPSTKLLFNLALQHARQSGREIIEAADFVAAACEDSAGVLASIVRSYNVHPKRLVSRLAARVRDRQNVQARVARRINRTPFLDRFKSAVRVRRIVPANAMRVDRKNRGGVLSRSRRRSLRHAGSIDVIPRVAKHRGPTLDDNLCFVASSFSDESVNEVYLYCVKPVLRRCHLRVERGDEVRGSNPIFQDIANRIRIARLVVADLTGANSNVMFEVGVADTLKKPMLLMAQSIQDVPFDLRYRRILFYGTSPHGCNRLTRDLRENVRAILCSRKTRIGKRRNRVRSKSPALMTCSQYELSGR